MDSDGGFGEMQDLFEEHESNMPSDNLIPDWLNSTDEVSLASQDSDSLLEGLLRDLPELDDPVDNEEDKERPLNLQMADDDDLYLVFPSLDMEHDYMNMYGSQPQEQPSEQYLNELEEEVVLVRDDHTYCRSPKELANLEGSPLLLNAVASPMPPTVPIVVNLQTKPKKRRERNTGRPRGRPWTCYPGTNIPLSEEDRLKRVRDQNNKSQRKYRNKEKDNKQE